MARVVLAVGLAAAAGGCATSSAGPAPEPEALTYAPSLGVDFAAMERTGSGLWIGELSPGSGKVAVNGDRVRIHFVGWLADGTPIDSSLGGEPFTFTLGDPGVIRGWNEGVRGMQVGARRRLVIRPGLGYGSRGRAPNVPPNAVLVFEIQLLDAN